ncbi:Crp/Fnr family transcriptional regulator [Bacillus sp. Marseille-P3661]|uniref:Crp/Fnr family transcriptional regulator n=1 Tax=Bacillus sp. Marseille-P3661 TaxID=1936234 RepID=UPI000C856927|nr:Crp/Fnr family transcriptional regulator [Bacillus sp. Marseille-P3661]
MIDSFIRKISILKGVKEEHYQYIEKFIKIETYSKNQHIFYEHEQAKAIYFVKTGIVKLKKMNPQGKEVVVCIKRSEEVFAEASLFCSGDIHYPATAQMLTDGEVAFISTAALEEIILDSRELSAEMIRMMSLKLREFTETLKDMTLLDVYGKTVKTLERLGKEYGKHSNCAVQIEIPLSIQELANIIGSSRETVSRVVSKLKDDDIILVSEKIISINNWCHFCTMSSKL